MKLKYLAVITPLIVFLDHLTKYWIVENIRFGERIVVIENIFDIVHTRNTGAAFGFLASWDSDFKNIFFYLLFIAAFIFLYSFLKQIPEHLKTGIASICLIVGGAIGNITDRLFRGSVVDFLSVHWYQESVSWNILGKPIHFDLVWPAFNVADSAISIGVVLLLWTTLKHPGALEGPKDEEE